MPRKVEKNQNKEEEIEFEIKNPELVVLSIFLMALFILQLRVTLNKPYSLWR
jgi:hypothetical protein